MSLWSAILSKLKEVVAKMIGSKVITDELRISPTISTEMEAAIQLWGDMYKNKAKWLHEPDDKDPTRIVSLGLASFIASEKARTALLEFNSEITTPTEDVEVDNPDYEEPEPDEFGNILPSIQPPTITEEQPTSDTGRAEYLNEQYAKLKKQLRTQLEFGIAKGGLVIKPYLVVNNLEDMEDNKKPVTPVQTKDKNTDDKAVITADNKEKEGSPINTPKQGKISYSMEFDFIQADGFYPLAFDAEGHITEAAFLQPKIDKEFIYYRLEYHKWQNNKVTIINKAYKSSNSTKDSGMGGLNGVTLGKPISLQEVPEWKDLPEEITIGPIKKPLFAYFKMPEANTVDVNSPLGVSGYSRAVQLIKDADIQYSRLLWEYEGGEMAIDIDRDAVRPEVDANGNTRSTMNHLQQRLYRFVDLSQTGDTYQPYAPSLRDANYMQGLNTIFMRIEDVTGLSRGTISDVAQEARTATEIKILKQRSFQTNADIQHALENCLKDVVYIMNAYCDIYSITPDGEYDVSFEWDDSIITDVETELGKRITLMQNGLCSKLELRMWYFGETERQAKDALMKVDEESQESMESNLMEQQNLARIGSNTKTSKDKQKAPQNKGGEFNGKGN